MFGRLRQLVTPRVGRALAGAATASAAAVFVFGENPAAALEPGALASEYIGSAGADINRRKSMRSRPKTVAEAQEDLHRARKRVAVFGGSFNPITNAHLNCAAEIIHSKLADEVWITPCGARPDKPSLKTPALHRLIMCHLAVDTTFGSRFGVKVCDEEMHEPRNVPTVVLMRRLKEAHPNFEFSFVVGSDLIPTLHEWDAPGCEGRWDAVPEAGKTFLKENHFLVIDRPGDHEEHNGSLSSNFELIAPALEARGSRLTETLLSSSEVRIRHDAHRTKCSALSHLSYPLSLTGAQPHARRRRHRAVWLEGGCGEADQHESADELIMVRRGRGPRPTVRPGAYREVRSLRAGGPDAERLKIKGECECCGEVRWDPYFAGLVLVGDGMSSRHRRGVFFV